MLGSIGKAIRSGGVPESKHVKIHEDVQVLSVTNDRPFPFQLDGDYLGETTELRFTHEPQAVRLVQPLLS